jgi:cystathionine beta-lyase family protein involved in aluminum resistance
MTRQEPRGDVDATVTRPVTLSLLARAGFARDDRGRWAHEDGRRTWATDEALRWALVSLAENEPQQAVARASESSERERERREDFGAAAIRAGTPDFGRNEVGRLFNDAIKAEDAASRLERIGLVHRNGAFLFPTRTAIRAADLDLAVSGEND